MLAERAVRLKCVCCNDTKFADTTREMCAYQCNKLITGVWMYPDTVLQTHKSSTLQ